MKDGDIFTAVIIDDQVTYTIVEVCQLLNIPERILDEMEAHGLFQRVVSEQHHEPVIASQSIQRIEVACRIQRDLGVNLPGAVLALELLDELNELRGQLALLERQISR